MALSRHGTVVVRERLGGIVLNAVIVAAFIGPGTVTVAASAGSRFGTTLLWALTFSIVTCFVLQETSARITVLSGRELGACIRHNLAVGSGVRRVLTAGVLAAVVIGCTAYQAGNLLGAVAGLDTVLSFDRTLTTLGVVSLAGLLLGLGSPQRIAAGLTLLVAVMGLAFVGLAVSAGPAAGQLLTDAVLPRVPFGSGTLILALLGTTVVPYNLFLGSGISRGRPLSDMRVGLAIAVGVGGVISMAVMVAATGLEGPFSFPILADLFGARWGSAGRGLFAAGLFAAGLTSAVTAPWAAALTVRSLAGDGDAERWKFHGTRFRAVWATVLLIGATVAVSGVRPVPVIVLAQALNGAMLPVVAVLLLMLANDRQRLGSAGVNRLWMNALTGIVVLLCLLLGLNQFFGVFRRFFNP